MVNINENIIIKRTAEQQVTKYLEPGKVIIVYGPRRVGKTTLLRQIATNFKSTEKIKWLEGELSATHAALVGRSLNKLKNTIGDSTLLIIDEAQAVPDIGMILKLVVDHLPRVKVIASGSASFNLARQIGEPLVGRKWTINLYPLWLGELKTHFDPVKYLEIQSDLLVYGSYPALIQITGRDKKQKYLENLVDSYLYRDILTLDSVRSSDKIRSLLQMLAWQIGHEVSLHELATALEMSTQTVARYLDLLEQVFVIKKIRGFSRNLRKEITRTSRYYFYDNGVRNALISNFNPVDPKLRNDAGPLWENWLVMERLKRQAYTSLSANNYFWRTYDQKEIDWLEEREGKLFGYEFSWSAKKIKKSTEREFKQAYPDSELSVIHRDNFEDFVLPNANSTPKVELGESVV